MVRGVDKFREFFAGHEGNYIIIGGTACEMHEETHAQTPRTTKDIDIILTAEVLSSDFTTKFWESVKIVGHRQRNKGTGNGECRHEYYRFRGPGNPDLPYQIELSSRDIGVVKFPDGAHITPIPVDDDLSSLSAILTGDDYHNYTIEHSTLEEDIHIANIESLTCPKCRAYLEMTEQENNGEQVDSKRTAKYKKDVFRLVAVLVPADTYRVPDSLKQDVDRFCPAAKEEMPNSGSSKLAGFKNISGEQLLEQPEVNLITQQ